MLIIIREYMVFSLPVIFYEIPQNMHYRISYGLSSPMDFDGAFKNHWYIQWGIQGFMEYRWIWSE